MSFETHIEFPNEGVTISADVTQVGPGLYRLDSVPLMVESASFRDIIEADRLDDGRLRFRRVAEKSHWRVHEFLLSKEIIEGPRIAALLARVLECGGHWERVFGGFLIICMPSDVDWDPTPEIMEKR